MSTNIPLIYADVIICPCAKNNAGLAYLLVKETPDTVQGPVSI